MFIASYSIPLSSSSLEAVFTARKRSIVGENVDFIWHKSSLSPRRILRRRSFPSDPLPRARTESLLEQVLHLEPSRRDFNALRDIPTPILPTLSRHIVFFFHRMSHASKKFCSRCRCERWKKRYHWSRLIKLMDPWSCNNIWFT